MTLPRYRALVRYWGETPPLAEVAAATLRAFGVVLSAPADDGAPSDGGEKYYSAEEALSLFAQAGFTVG